MWVLPVGIVGIEPQRVNGQAVGQAFLPDVHTE